MAESVVKDFKGKLDWVYVGKGEAPKPKEKKADTLLNEYMRKVFDVAEPVAVSEIKDFTATQGNLAVETAVAMAPDGMDTAVGKKKFIERCIQNDPQGRWGKLLMGALYMVGSLITNFGSGKLAKEVFRDDGWLAGKVDKDNGNLAALSNGWENLTDIGVMKLSDWSVKHLTCRENVGFVSPLARSIGRLGNTLLTVTGDMQSHETSALWKKILINPGFVEGFFRFAGAIPGAGFMKDLYGWANKQIMKGEGIVPIGAELAGNMLWAKMANKKGDEFSGKS